MSDQRSAERIDHKLALKFAGGRSPLTWAMSTNVGPGGLFVVSSTPPRPGTRLDLELDLPDCIIRIGGRSVWQRVARRRGVAGEPAGFGVRFSDPPPEWTSFIAGLGAAP